MEELSKLNGQTIENVFKEFKPPEIIQEIPEEISVAESSNNPKDTEIEVMIKDIIDMFPHLGDGKVFLIDNNFFNNYRYTFLDYKVVDDFWGFCAG